MATSTQVNSPFKWMIYWIYGTNDDLVDQIYNGINTLQ